MTTIILPFSAFKNFHGEDQLASFVARLGFKRTGRTGVKTHRGEFASAAEVSAMSADQVAASQAIEVEFPKGWGYKQGVRLGYIVDDKNRMRVIKTSGMGGKLNLDVIRRFDIGCNADSSLYHYHCISDAAVFLSFEILKESENRVGEKIHRLIKGAELGIVVDENTRIDTEANFIVQEEIKALMKKHLPECYDPYAYWDMPQAELDTILAAVRVDAAERMKSLQEKVKPFLQQREPEPADLDEGPGGMS